jgi:hypothetical protein
MTPEYWRTFGRAALVIVYPLVYLLMPRLWQVALRC